MPNYILPRREGITPSDVIIPDFQLSNHTDARVFNWMTASSSDARAKSKSNIL